MDAFSAMLDGPRARDAVLLRALLDPPWSMRIEDEASLALFVPTRGEAWVVHEGAEPLRVGAGDVCLVRGPDHYTVADAPTTRPQIRIDPQQQCWSVSDGRLLSAELSLGVRTWGTSRDADTALLVGCYDLASQLTPLVVGSLPRTAVVPASAWTSPLLHVLHDEIGRDGPGQAVVLERLLDLVLIEALRLWFAGDPAHAPRWWVAGDDPVVGPAVRALQEDPARGWTVALLAREVGVSRAALARRFTDVVGEPPMAFVAGWRLSLAADRLRGGSETVAAIARAVGYGSPFALSAAFKRRHGLSPAEFRRATA